MTELANVNNPTPEITIKVTVGGVDHVRSLSEDLRVDEEHINDYLMAAPGKTAWWHHLWQEQRNLVQKQEVKLKRKAAELDLHFRELAAGERKISNPEVEARISCDEEYQALEDELLSMKETLNVLAGAKEAIHELRSTLISLSANMRAEFKPTRVKKVTDAQESAGAKFLRTVGKD